MSLTIISWMSQMKKNWPFSVCSWQIFFFLTSVLVAKNATGLNFTILCSFSFQGCLESFL